jgi:hypothetical protein
LKLETVWQEKNRIQEFVIKEKGLFEQNQGLMGSDMNFFDEYLKLTQQVMFYRDPSR